MNRVIFRSALALGLFFLLFSSCNKLKELQEVKLFLKTKEVTMFLPPSAAGTRQESKLFDFDFAAEIEKANAGSVKKYTLDDIESAKVSKVSIEIVNNASATNNFANFTYAFLLFVSDANPNTQSQTSLADVPNIPDTYSIKLEPSLFGTTDFKEYLKGKKFVHTLNYNLRRATTVFLETLIKVEFEIKIKP